MRDRPDSASVQPAAVFWGVGAGRREDDALRGALLERPQSAKETSVFLLPFLARLLLSLLILRWNLGLSLRLRLFLRLRLLFRAAEWVVAGEPSPFDDHRSWGRRQ